MHRRAVSIEHQERVCRRGTCRRPSTICQQLQHISAPVTNPSVPRLHYSTTPPSAQPTHSTALPRATVHLISLHSARTVQIDNQRRGVGVYFGTQIHCSNHHHHHVLLLQHFMFLLGYWYISKQQKWDPQLRAEETQNRSVRTNLPVPVR